jgi:hypothetical protein
MKQTLSDRRMAENQVYFRQFNESVTGGFKELRNLAKEDKQPHFAKTPEMPLLFYCECSDENCRKRIKVSFLNYQAIHKNKNNFVIVCGHEVKQIEEVTTKENDYCVVTKNFTPPQSAKKSNITNVDNTKS